MQSRQEVFSLDPRGRFHSWICLYQFGWPLTMHQGFRPMPDPEISEHVAGRSLSPAPHPYIKPEHLDAYRQPVGFDGEWVRQGLLFNGLTLVLILAASAAACEWLLRRRAVRG